MYTGLLSLLRLSNSAKVGPSLWSQKYSSYIYSVKKATHKQDNTNMLKIPLEIVNLMLDTCEYKMEIKQRPPKFERGVVSWNLNDFSPLNNFSGVDFTRVLNKITSIRLLLVATGMNVSVRQLLVHISLYFTLCVHKHFARFNQVFVKY